MKKLMITALMLIGIGISASAQNWGLGVNLGYGNDVSKPSFGIKALYDINEEFTLAPSLNFYLPETESASSGGASLEAELKCWDINADVHWNFYNTNKGRYGYRRICAVLKAKGYEINHKTVLKLMKALKLRGKQSKNGK